MKPVDIPDFVAERFTSSRRVAALTGAGVSAESGVDTFRGPDGTWSKVKIEEVATPQAFSKDPSGVWSWYDQRRVKLATIEPNPAHYALAEMDRHFEEFSLITQNIDGLHKKAGSRNIIELHGNIWRVRNTRTGELAENLEAPLKDIPPYSDEGDLLRPDVVWFGEMLPPGAIEASIAAAESCELFLVIGTSAIVQPAASLPFYAQRAGALVVEVTLHPTEITRLVDHSFIGKAGEILPLLVGLLN